MGSARIPTRIAIRTVAIGTVLYLGAYVVGIVFLIVSTLMGASLLPEWVHTGLGVVANAVFLAGATRLVLQLEGMAPVSRRVVFSVAAYWVSGLAGALAWSLFVGTDLLMGEVRALVFGVLAESTSGLAFLGTHWTLTVPVGLAVVIAAALLPRGQRNGRSRVVEQARPADGAGFEQQGSGAVHR